MEHKASGFDVQTPARRRIAGPSEALRDRDHRCQPRSRGINRSSRADAFSAFSEEVRKDLNPRGPLESVLADHVVSTAWRLKRAVKRQAHRRLADTDLSDRAVEGSKPASPSAADRAARSVKEALESLDQVGKSMHRRRGPVGPDRGPIAFECEVEPNEWPIVPFERPEAPAGQEPVAEDDASPIWRDRLAYDFEISEISPVVRGTWITVGQVISLVVDGCTWADILRSHPELTEEDIRSCVAYTMAQAQGED